MKVKQAEETGPHLQSGLVLDLELGFIKGAYRGE